eukprot:6163002-Alexandrium_andersonii.AAC.1
MPSSSSSRQSASSGPSRLPSPLGVPRWFWRACCRHPAFLAPLHLRPASARAPRAAIPKAAALA